MWSIFPLAERERLEDYITVMRLLISAAVVLGISLTPSCATITTLCDMQGKLH